MSDQLFRDLANAIQGGDPERITELLHDIRRAGPAKTPERIALVEPLLHHTDWTVRHAALFVLCSRWRLPHLREVARDLWEHDPNEEIRCAALLGWTSYNEHIGNPEWPRVSYKVTERTDWALVWRLVGSLGVDLSPYRPPGRAD